MSLWVLGSISTSKSIIYYRELYPTIVSKILSTEKRKQAKMKCHNMWNYHMEEHIPPKTPSWNSQALTFWTHLLAFFNGHHPCIYDHSGSVTYSQRKSSAYIKRDVSAS